MKIFFSTVFVGVGLVGSSHICATKAMGKVWLMAPENERICPPWKWKDNVIKPNHPDDFVDTPRIHI